MSVGNMGFAPGGSVDIDGKALEKSGQGATAKRVLKSLACFKGLIMCSLLMALISVVFTLLVPIKIGNAIDHLGEISISGPFGRNMILAGIFAVVVGLSTYVMNLINNRITYAAVRDLRNRALEKVEHLPLKYLDNRPKGDIVSCIISDADQYADGLLMGFTQAFTGILTIFLTLILMLRMNAAIALVVVVITPLSIFVAKFISSKTYEMFRLQSKERGEQTGIIEEMISNEKVVKAFGHENMALRDFDEVNERLKRSSQRAVFFSSLTNPCTRFVNSLCYALVIMVGSFCLLWDEGGIFGTITVGTLTVFLSYASQYTKPFNEISGVIADIQNALACAARVFEIIDADGESSDEELDGLEDVLGRVDIEKVEFSYSEDKELIKDFDLHVLPGQRVAIVGPTGCGKTTLINLLMRFYDVKNGTISADGRDIRSIKRESLRRAYGMVLQDTWLKRGTIKENIKISKEDATDEEIIRAAKLSCAHSFIRRLPDGYDTMIEEEGGTLSAGQKQLLCITRVMLNLPPMLILDEATSSIDTRTEINIQKAFNTMMEGRTSFIVAHRLSTIVNADIILVMKDGHIVEQGKHKELLKKKGFYYELYNSQFGEA